MTDIVSDTQSVLTVGADDGQKKGETMSLIVKGIDLPPNAKVQIIVESPTKSFRMPLPKSKVLQIPAGHGRLIDENMIQGALIAEAYKNDGKFQLGDTIKWTPSEVEEIISNNVPTILESEE